MFFSKLWFWLLIIIVLVFGVVGVASAVTNINSASSSQVMWNDVFGWANLYETNTVEVTGSLIRGYASSSIGDISFDCSTSPSGNVCGTSNYSVCNGTYVSSTETCNADSLGVLSGYAWNDTIGWISFNCYNHGNCSPSYQVSINTGTGDFSGYAWNDTVGWISFNCVNHSGCGVVNYLVNTDWRMQPTVGYLESATVDTQVVGGATLNSITWEGDPKVNDMSGNTYVGFQIATADSAAGPWTFYGPGGSSTDFYDTPCSGNSFVGGTGYVGDGNGAPPAKPICVDPSQVANKRYLRYKFQLRSNLLQTDTPRIEKIILNWSK